MSDELNRLRARIAELEAREVTMTGALKDLADDHEFGATGTVRQDHLQAARAALRGEEVDRGSEAKDPREVVLRETWFGLLGVAEEDHDHAVIDLLHDLDAADPLRAMLGEVVEALEQSWSPYKDDTPPDVRWHARRDRILARLRTATEGGTDNEE
jgi:hypothetical protein